MNRTGYLSVYTMPRRISALALPLLVVLVLATPAMAAPIITLSPSTGTLGTKITVTGTNFESYRGDSIFIFFNDYEVSGSPLTVPSSGSFGIDFNVPENASPGTHRIEVRSETSSSSMLARSFFIIPDIGIKLDRVEGTVDSTATIDGTGFYAGRTVTIYYYNRSSQKLGTEIASATGSFSYRFTIPNSAAGKHKIIVENQEGSFAEVEFTVIPSTTLNQTSGSPGDILTVRGNGFGYRSDVSIYFRSDEVAYARTDEYGNFEVTFNVPEMNSGSYDVKTVDEDGNIDRARFVIIAGAKLNKISGAVGTELGVSGSGFKPGGTVTINYDALPTVTFVTDGSGSFSGAFYVPISASGKHIVTITDGATTKQLAFSVESVAPPIPALLLPINASEIKARAYLDWTDITDPSMPVTYGLQLASDQNFSTVVLEKSNLTGSEYTLTKDEVLPAVKKEAPYYWRVKARDSAGNESEWSSPWSFHVAAPPPPALLAPEMESKAEAMVHFDWEDVTDLSPPITYGLQVASDQNFSSLVLSKTELAGSEYSLTEDEKLAAVKKEVPYHWRVIATDSAGNKSEWSFPWIFYVGFSFTLPGVVLYTLIGLGAIIIGIFAFLVGRKTAYLSKQ